MRQEKPQPGYYKPTFAEEKRLAAEGYHLIAGVDEAGRGALAGPVVAGAVIMPPDPKGSWTELVKDSKLLAPEEREFLFPYITEAAVSCGTGIVAHELIDAYDIVIATRIAMRQAIEQLAPQPETLLIDYLLLPEIPLPQKGIVDGDRLCFSIACASIIAKVTRDHIMIELDAVYPGYGLARHKGYCTDEHVLCLYNLGPAYIHRISFHPVRDLLGL